MCTHNISVCVFLGENFCMHVLVFVHMCLYREININTIAVAKTFVIYFSVYNI